MNRARFFCLVALALAGTLIAGCGPNGLTPRGEGRLGGLPQDSLPPAGTQGPATSMGQQGQLRETVRVAILVPQSGPNAAIGDALMQAAQLAVFDLNEPMFQLVPKDTLGTAEGTRAAVIEAAHEGVKLILGPLFAQEVEAARDAARPFGITVIGFSTDWRVAGDSVFTMGLLPFGQVERIADFAARQGLKRIAVLATKDLYGDAAVSLFESAAQRNGSAIVKTVRLSPDGRDAQTAVQTLLAGQPAFDAVFMPAGGQTARGLAAALKGAGIDTGRVRLLGTGLWDDATILRDPAMAGAFYAAPAPQTRAAFERNYQRVYGASPPRLASIGYDAAALAIVLARNAAASGAARVAYDRSMLLNPNGFSGVDGIFRFRTNGLVERGMAVLQIAPGGPRIIEAAPASFVGAAPTRQGKAQ